MKNNTPLIVIAILLVLFGGIAVGRFAIAPLAAKYFNKPAIGGTPMQPSEVYMLATPDGDEPIDHEAGAVSGIANGAAGDATLQTDVWNAILKAESDQKCTDVTSDDIDLVQKPDAKGAWIEEWTVKACGNVRAFKVKFYPNVSGSGTSFEISG